MLKVFEIEIAPNFQKLLCFFFLQGAIYIFSFFNAKEERTRYKYLIYYSFCFMENTALIIIWWVNIYASAVVYSFFKYGTSETSLILLRNLKFQNNEPFKELMEFRFKNTALEVGK